METFVVINTKHTSQLVIQHKIYNENNVIVIFFWHISDIKSMASAITRFMLW